MESVGRARGRCHATSEQASPPPNAPVAVGAAAPPPPPAAAAALIFQHMNPAQPCSLPRGRPGQRTENQRRHLSRKLKKEANRSSPQPPAPRLRTSLTPQQILQYFGCPTLDWTAERDRFMSIAGKEPGGVYLFRAYPQTKVIFQELTGTPAYVAKSLVTLVFNTMIRTKEVRASCVPPVNVLCPLWCVPPVNHRCAYVALVCVLCVCPCLPLLVSPLCYPCTRTPLPGTSFAPCVPPCSPPRQFFFLHCPPAG